MDATPGVTLPTYSFPLAPQLKVSRLVTGLWQVADLEREGGLGLDKRAALESLEAHHKAGFSTFDMADHYGSAEDLIGCLVSSISSPGPKPLIFTKWVPKPGAKNATPGAVDEAVKLSLSRLAIPLIPLLQFHTWDYLDGPGIYLEQLRLLQSHDQVQHVGVTNMDTAHLRLAMAEGIPVVSNQVCFSLIDRRASGEMSALCIETGMRLLAFGVLAGGLLTDRFLGRAEPSHAELAASWSLAKYYRFVKCFGGWKLLQELLAVLRDIADQHTALKVSTDSSESGHVVKRVRRTVSIANIATRWVLEQPAVAAVIVGVRPGLSEHIMENAAVFDLELNDQDHQKIKDVLVKTTPIHGDCGDEYRRPPFLTASGDLSHHLSEVPNAFSATELPGHTALCPRLRVDMGASMHDAGCCQAVRKGTRIFVSGTSARGPSGKLVGGTDAAAQTTYALDVVEASLKALGCSFGDIICTRLFVRRACDLAAVSKVHRQRFGEYHVASTLVQSELEGDEVMVLVEAEAQL